MKSITYQFTVENNGKTYHCERVVIGERVLYQEIYVIGVGSKGDPARYSAKSHPPESMESTANLIAHEIIRGI